MAVFVFPARKSNEADYRNDLNHGILKLAGNATTLRSHVIMYKSEKIRES